MALPPLPARKEEVQQWCGWSSFERHSGFFRSSSGLNLWCCCHGKIISMVPKWLTESRLKSRKYIANNSSFLCIQGNSWMASGKWLDLNWIVWVKHWCRKYFQYAIIYASDLKNILLWKRDQGTFCSWIQIGSKMMYSQVPVKPLLFKAHWTPRKRVLLVVVGFLCTCALFQG